MPPWSPEEAWSAWNSYQDAVKRADSYQDAVKRADRASARASRYLDRLIEEKRKSNHYEVSAIEYHQSSSFWEKHAEDMRLAFVRERDSHDKYKKLHRRYYEIAEQLAGRRIWHAENLQRSRQLWRFSARSQTIVEDDVYHAYTEMQAADGNQSAINRLRAWSDEVRGGIRTEL